MKRSAAVILWMVVTALLVFVTPVWGQSGNLLTNPGFEPPFSAFTGNPPRQVAQGWTPWHISGGASTAENAQPEYYPASDVSNGLGVPRIRSGSDAQQYHTFFATHDGGLYQRVTGVTPGTLLRFSAFIYVWSSSFDDPNKSENDGGVVVQVGIDPTGGTDSTSANIIWSAPVVQYDAYNQYFVAANASTSAVTVFIRSTVTAPVKSSNIYVDDAVLSAESPATATHTLTPTATQTPTVTPSATATQPGAATVTPSLTPTLTLTPTITFTPTPTQEIFLPTATPITPVPTATSVIPPGEFGGTIIHIVRAGDTVGALAALYGSTIQAIIQANGLTASGLIFIGQSLVIPVRLAAPATSTPPAVILPTATPTFVLPQVPPDTGVYIIQRGDTLFRIALRFNTTVAAIARLNGIANPNLIYAGQRLLIAGGGIQPPPAAINTYMVRPGDTLFRIALRLNAPVSALIQANGIVNPNLIFVGQVLIIP